MLRVSSVHLFSILQEILTKLAMDYVSERLKRTVYRHRSICGLCLMTVQTELYKLAFCAEFSASDVAM